MSISKVYLLWKLLLRNIKNLNTCQAKAFFKGKYRWWRFTDDYEKEFEAKFLKTLKQKTWLVDKNNNFRKSSEITFSELSDDYIKENPNMTHIL